MLRHRPDEHFRLVQTQYWRILALFASKLPKVTVIYPYLLEVTAVTLSGGENPKNEYCRALHLHNGRVQLIDMSSPGRSMFVILRDGT